MVINIFARGIGLGCLILFIYAKALACSCSPEASAPACHLISRAEVAFLGQSLELVPDPSGRGRLYRFRVERVYKGLDQNIKELLVNPDNFTSCGTSYPTGKKYLIFASTLAQKPLVLIAGCCSGSRDAGYHKSDIEYLERYVRGNTETEVYGKVLQDTAALRSQ